MLKLVPLALVAALAACSDDDPADDSPGTGGAAGSGETPDAAGAAGSAGAAAVAGAAGAGGAPAGGGHVNVREGGLAVSDRGGCVIDAAGDLRCWGFLSDHAPRAGSAVFTHVSAFYGDDGACALDSEGGGWCWNASSTLELPATGPLKHIAAGSTYACAVLQADGSLSCWATATSDPSPILEPPDGEFVRVAGGDFSACALRTDGSVACWGEPLLGALDAAPGEFERVATGEFYSCAAGTASNACWGGSTPAQPPLERLAAMSVASSHACGLLENGTVRCWGDAPAGAPDETETFREISVATRHACAVRSEDGTVKCWGELSASQTPPSNLVVR